MFPKEVHQWLSNRGINDEIIHKYSLRWDGSRIVIPIKDENGKILFNKYRRDPRVNDGPKYTYEKGSNISLFNYQSGKKTIVLTEGEFDTLRLESIGIHGVSGTGGAGSFPDEWIPLLENKELFICYDNDPAGVNGIIKITSKIPNIRVVSFPAYWQGKDITDYLEHHTKEEFEKLLSRAYQLPIPKDKTIKEINYSLEACNELRRTLKRGTRDVSTQVLDQYVNYLNELKSITKRRTNKELFIKNVTDVKEIPITHFVDFNIANFAPCLWHTPDKSPSMKYYPETNSLYCFSCGHYGDVIAVIRKIHNKSFSDAINYLKNL